MAIGVLEILFCVLVAAGAGGLYCLLRVLLGQGKGEAIRRDGLVLLGFPVLCLVAAAVTPPDLITQLFLAVPLCVLYGLAVAIWLVIRYRDQLFGRRDMPDSDCEKDG